MRPTERLNIAALYLLGTLLLLYPALLNGFPLLYPDSLDYIHSGDSLISYFLRGETRRFGLRSEVFSASIFFLHGNRFLWGPIILSALITIWTFHRVTKGDTRSTLALTVFTALLTPLSWHLSRVMPDYLAGFVVLWGFLLVFEQDLTRTSVVLLSLLLAYGVLSHTSHLLVVVGVLLVFSPFLVKHKPQGFRRVGLALVCALVFQALFSSTLYGRPNLANPDAPPFLLCRVLADGTGVRYLEEHPEHPLAPYRHLVSSDTNINLWDKNGLRNTLTREQPELWQEVRENEIKFVSDVVLRDPFAQLRVSTKNAVKQLLLFRLDDFFPNAYIEQSLLGPWLSKYKETPQYRRTLPLDQVTRVHTLVLLLSLLSLPLLLRKYATTEQKALCLSIAVALLLYTIVTGVISTPDLRYGSRVIWMVPFGAFCLLLRRP